MLVWYYNKEVQDLGLVTNRGHSSVADIDAYNILNKINSRKNQILLKKCIFHIVPCTLYHFMSGLGNYSEPVVACSAEHYSFASLGNSLHYLYKSNPFSHSINSKPTYSFSFVYSERSRAMRRAVPCRVASCRVSPLKDTT